MSCVVCHSVEIEDPFYTLVPTTTTEVGGRGRGDDDKIFCGMAQPRASHEQGSYERCSSCCVRNYSGTELPRPLRRRTVMSRAPRRSDNSFSSGGVQFRTRLVGPVLSDPSCQSLWSRPTKDEMRMGNVKPS